MVNFKERVLLYPQYCRQFTCSDSLITMFNCPPTTRLVKTKYVDLWSHENYIFYVLEGKKVWHTSQDSFEIGESSCILVRKGACILEQFFDIGFCVVLFFIPDDFICKTLQNKAVPLLNTNATYKPVIKLNSSATLKSFFASMYSYFTDNLEPDKSLLELKFKELILNITDNPQNVEARSYFCSLMNEPQSVSLQRVMEDNCSFNLNLQQYAVLSNRSLSAFKRDFKKLFKNTPGKWLLEKRLLHANYLLGSRGKTISEAAFESGFENTSHFSRCFKKSFGIAPSLVKQKQAI